MIKAATLTIFFFITGLLPAQYGMSPLIVNGSLFVNGSYPEFCTRYGLNFCISQQFVSSTNGGFNEDGIFMRPVTFVQPYWDAGFGGSFVHSITTNELVAWEIEFKQTSMAWSSFRTMDRNERWVKLLQALGVSAGYGRAINGDRDEWIYTSININRPPPLRYNRHWFGGRFRISIFGRWNYFLRESRPLYMEQFQCGIRFDILRRPWFTYSRYH